MACVRNYVLAAQKWFGVSFDDLNIATMPITFDMDQAGVEAVAKKPGAAVTKFLKHMQALEAHASDTKSQFSFSISISYDVQRKKVDGAIPVRADENSAGRPIVFRHNFARRSVANGPPAIGPLSHKEGAIWEEEERRGNHDLLQRLYF